MVREQRILAIFNLDDTQLFTQLRQVAAYGPRLNSPNLRHLLHRRVAGASLQTHILLHGQVGLAKMSLGDKPIETMNPLSKPAV
jgi:hypothetical protein